MSNLEVNICNINFKNPVMPTSGTFGSYFKMSKFMNVDILGAVVTKGVSSNEWKGNPTPRVCEVTSGMLNSIGLQNPGVDEFIAEELPFYEKYRAKGGVLIVNIAGHTIEEYIEVIEKLNDKNVDMFELNISCPNVDKGGVAFGTDEKVAFEVVSKVKKICKKPLIVKLSPNVTDIVAIAKSVEKAGADAISLTNTLIGTKIDINKRKFVLARKYGGFSGPAIKPVSLRMVHQVCQNVKIPVIGIGGILNYEDALEFIMAGASLVGVGTATFNNPDTMEDIINDMDKWLDDNNIESLDEIRGVVK